MSVCLSVRRSVGLPAWNASAPTGGIFIKFDVRIFFKILSRKLKFYLTRTGITCALHEARYTFLFISRSDLGMRNVSDKICWENKNTRLTFSYFFSPENRAVYEIMYKTIVKPGRPQITIWRMPIACWIPMATNTHSEYVILIDVQL
jgi:hypothetical protein